MNRMNCFGCVLIAAVLGLSANAACGGGGYKPAPAANAPVSSNVSYSSSSSTSSPSTTYHQSTASSGFDVSSFHNVSGKLHLTSEQATNVISAIQDIRRKLETNPSPKEFDPHKEFETRLATILQPEQLKTYHDAVKPS